MPMHRTWPILIAALGLALGLFPLSAFAHLVSTGLGPVYDGFGHFLLSLEDLLPLLALMILGGMHGEVAGRRAMLVLPPVWLLAALVTALAFQAASLPVFVSTLLTIGLGILVSLDRRMPLAGLTVLILFVATLSGQSTGIALAGQAGSVLMILGSTAALFVVATLVPALVLKISSRAPWLRIAMRVFGSWIAGVGLLMLGWQLRG